MSSDPPHDQRHVHRATAGFGLASVIGAAAVSTVLTAFLVWVLGLSALWAVLIYPCIGALLTFVFSTLIVRMRRGPNDPMPQSLQVQPQSREQTPPR